MPVKKGHYDVLYFTLFPLHPLRSTTLNNPQYRLETASLSDTGRVRAINEDAVAVDADYGFAIVADGMGGHRAGEVASHLARDLLKERLPAKVQQFRAGARQPMPLQFAEQIIGEANRAIFATAQKQAGCAGMGTTVAVALFYGENVGLLHVGDSRIYRLRGGKLQLLTRDDSLLHDQVERGVIAVEDARESHNRHLVTQALGVAAGVTIHLQEENVQDGDVFLLCTDGLNDLVEDSDIELIVDSLKTNLPLAAGHLVQLANDHGGYDNVSVALIRILAGESSPSPDRQGWFARLFGWLAS